MFKTFKLTVLAGVACVGSALSSDNDHRHMFGGPGYEISWNTVDGGGGSSSGGGFVLTGTIGQPDAGTLTGGAFVLSGGYWQSLAAPCPWDLTGDGHVNAADLAQLLGNWGPNPGHPADFNGDDMVNAADLAPLLGNWGPCP